MPGFIFEMQLIEPNLHSHGKNKYKPGAPLTEEGMIKYFNHTHISVAKMIEATDMASVRLSYDKYLKYAGLKPGKCAYILNYI